MTKKGRYNSDVDSDKSEENDSDSRSSVNNDDDDDSSSSSSKRHRHHRHDHKTKSKKKTKAKMKKKKSSRHKRKYDEKHHRKKEKKRKRSRKYEDDKSTDDDYDDDDDSRSRNREKKSSKKRKREHTHKAHDDDDSLNEPASACAAVTNNRRALAVIQILKDLFSKCPVFIQELPILLIRLAGGSTFDLRQMTDSTAAQGLHLLFSNLQEFGVEQNTQTGEWYFQRPPGPAASRLDELVLLRVIRSFLDDVGVTMEAIEKYETKKKQEQSAAASSGEKQQQQQEDPAIPVVQALTSRMIFQFQSKDATLGTQLASLCQSIAQGESISIDGIPDEDLRKSLQEIFTTCGLEKSQIIEHDDEEEENDSDNDNKDEDAEPLWGYGLPDDNDKIDGRNSDMVQIRLAAVMEACRNPKRRTLGPQRPSHAEAAASYKDPIPNNEDDDEDEEGPALPGKAKKRREPGLSMEDIQAQAEYRQLQLKATKAGVDMPTVSGGREEWMIVPGKYDFLSNIKAGHAITSRGFQNKKSKKDNDDADDARRAPVHPAIQAEMDAIMKAHEDARGPSLMDQHRAKIQEEKAKKMAASAGESQKWKWSRDQDLDAGRRVDKDALHMVLGGAADNLKTKFQGGFR